MKLEAKPTKPLRILIIAAHPDDIEFGAGGSAAVWTEAGAQVTYCLVTDGAAGSNEKDADLAQLKQRRKEEQLAAAKIVGVTDVRFLDYADGSLQPTLELRRDLTRVIREIRPDRVVIQDPTAILLSRDEDGNDGYINHPDHRATGEAALYAVFPSAETRPIFPELLEEGLEPVHIEELYLQMSDKSNIAVDITTVHDRKLQSLLSHRSQLNEEALDWVTSFDKEMGKLAGVEYAEIFRVIRFPTDRPQENKDAPTD